MLSLANSIRLRLPSLSCCCLRPMRWRIQSRAAGESSANGMTHSHFRQHLSLITNAGRPRVPNSRSNNHAFHAHRQAAAFASTGADRRRTFQRSSATHVRVLCLVGYRTACRGRGFHLPVLTHAPQPRLRRIGVVYASSSISSTRRQAPGH